MKYKVCTVGLGYVGLPLAQPDLETKELIAYFEQKFGKDKEKTFRAMLEKFGY